MDKPVIAAVNGVAAGAGASLALATLPAAAQTGPELLEQIKIMRQQLEEQRARVDDLERQLRAAGTTPAPADPTASPSRLAGLRGTGNGPVQEPQAPSAPASAPVGLCTVRTSWWGASGRVPKAARMSPGADAREAAGEREEM